MLALEVGMLSIVVRWWHYWYFWEFRLIWILKLFLVAAVGQWHQDCNIRMVASGWQHRDDGIMDGGVRTMVSGQQHQDGDVRMAASRGWCQDGGVRTMALEWQFQDCGIRMVCMTNCFGTMALGKRHHFGCVRMLMSGWLTLKCLFLFLTLYVSFSSLSEKE